MDIINVGGLNVENWTETCEKKNGIRNVHLSTGFLIKSFLANVRGLFSTFVMKKGCVE